MKKIILTIIFTVSAFLSVSAQEEETFHLTIEISGMKSNKGRVLVALYKGKEDFLKKRFRGDVAKIKDKKATTVFKNLAPGIYAVSLFHDENNNQKMDTNFFGIPKESYGTSNDAKGFMGPPKYEDAKFTITKNKTIVINIED